MVLVVLAVFAAVLVAAPAMAGTGTFIDDDGNVHEGFIEAIADAGITKGCNPPVNDRYCPSESVTRGQMAAFLVRALDLTDDGAKDWFVDDDGSVFEADINRLATAGITLGCNPPASDRFCPSDSVTRGQMAAFLVRAFGYTDPGSGDWFNDDDGSVFEADIDRLRQAGLCDPEIFDVIAVASGRSFFAKLVDSLGVEPDCSYLEMDESLRRPLTVGRPISREEAETLDRVEA
jgi:hypothetical protein